MRASTKGNRRLKDVLFSANLTLLTRDGASRVYFGTKRAESKGHAAAMLCLTRRRVDVLHAMLRIGDVYRPPAQLSQVTSQIAA